MTIQSRLKLLGRSQRIGIAALLVGILGTIVWVQLIADAFKGSGGSAGSSIVSKTVHPTTGISFHASLSHPKVVQGEDGIVYLDLGVDIPEVLLNEMGRAPTDVLVVLDRSGSMGEGSKWAYATKAFRSLLDRLQPEDRIGLISFDSTARLESELAYAGLEHLNRLRRLVDHLAPGASTNLGDALLTAERTVADRVSSERRRRILVLSDGHANVGIVDPEVLGSMARRLADAGSVVSTIGMGLGFNETLMASLADMGMGSFNYLEHLESLGAILARELADSRLIYADGSEIRLTLPEGVDLVDTAGYPLSFEGRTAVIRTGQLLQGNTKRFMVTLRIPSARPAEYKLGALELVYRVQGKSYQQQIQGAGLQVACVAPERRAEVVASIDKEVYEDAWLRNNLGSVMRQVSDYIRSGEKHKAVEFIDSYRSRLDEVNEIVPGVREKADRELTELEGKIEEAFQGRDQKTKQNRAAKSLLSTGQELQRTTDKNPH